MTKQLKELLQPLVGLLVITAIFFILSPTYRQPAAIQDILEEPSRVTRLFIRDFLW